MTIRSDLNHLVAEADAAFSGLRTAAKAALMHDIQQRGRGLLDTIGRAVADGDVDRAAALLGGFFVPLVESEYAGETEALLEALLARDDEFEQPQRRFRIHEAACGEAFLRGDAVADDHCQVLFKIVGATGSDDLLARALIARCRLRLRSDDAEGLESDAAELAEVAQRTGDSFYAGFAPHMLANLREMQERTDEAIEHYTDSSRLFADADAGPLLLTEVFNLAACHVDLGDHAGARQRLAETMRIMRELDDRHIEPELLSCLAALTGAEGDPETAALLIGATDASLREHGRVLYPAEAQASQRTREQLEETLGSSRYEELRRDGLRLDINRAVELAAL